MSASSQILVRGEESQGRVSIIEITPGPGWAGPRLHHHDFDEAFYVLDGELTFQLEDELVTARAGAFAFAPAGMVHTLANRSDAPARYLLVCTPAGFERRFEDTDLPSPEVIMVGDPIDPDAPAGRELAPAGDGLQVLLRGTASGDRIGVTRNPLPPGAGPSLHRHDFEEAFYILDGELLMQIGDSQRRVRAGELVFVAGGVPHGFTNPTDEPAAFFLVITPAGFERHFARMAAEWAGVEPDA